MSATLFVLVPVGIMAVVWSLCFVGCFLNASGVPSPYSDTIVVRSGLVAYWPLSDLLGTPNTKGTAGKAGDLSGNGHDGTYTIPPAYPSGAQAVAKSKPITTPSLARNPSILPGDAGSVKNPLPASVDFEGGFVSIPWSAQTALSDFTFEAWIKPNWSDKGFLRVVFSAFINNTGFVVFIDDNNNLSLTLGTGTGNMMPPSTVSIDLTSTTYMAVTFDSSTGTIKVWVNPVVDIPTPPRPNQTINATYAPIDPGQPVTFFIGAGANDQPLRTQDGGTGAPLFPFQGLIQSVALYNVVLDGTEIQSHFELGETGSVSVGGGL